MNDYLRLKSLNEKITRLLEAAGNTDGKFASLDKDLLCNYMREAYELVLGIEPQHQDQQEVKVQQEQKDASPLHGDEKQTIPEKAVVNGQHSHKENGKSISELYSEKKEDGKATVNEKFKKQGMEIADKLRQTPIRDLKSYIGLNKQFAFMSKLFNADEQLYEKAIASLNCFSSYAEATTYIEQQLLPELHWNDEEPLVAEFFALIMRRYLN